MKKISITIFNKHINKLYKTGFFSIFLSTVFSKILTFFGGIILIRILSKSDYGIYAYILNCISMLYLLNDLGVSTASLQYLTENHNNKDKQVKILKFAIKAGIVASSISSILILLSPSFYPFTIETAKKITPILFGIPILSTLNSFISIILRANEENKKYGNLQILSTIVSYIWLILLSYIFGFIGAVVSQYFYNITILILGLCFIDKKFIKLFKLKHSKLIKKDKNEFLKFSLFSQFNNTIGGLLLTSDTFLIGLLIANSEIVALYKVASTIPSALTFIPISVMIYVLPYFIKNNKNIKWLKKNFKKMIFCGIISYGIICLSLIIGSKILFKFLFGTQYLEAVIPFNILMIGYFFSAAFKIPCSNITHSMRKININIIINIIAIIINIISNVIFINKFGYVGAAITTTLINVITSIIYILIVNKILKSDSILEEVKCLR